ncbi:uncharacterized protein BDR25DRAFT_355139 [Lindgomyces ingoldianus]|uniref:Uncharacterized protein n=1 Tax=Lindgomyces ingoldianus TaxID=673940 RepID=A0ACB6QX49_9PLEO|nr:uncharacterized protein BDR25DRAFT_355139 [Lindgomyces ingoldianus]KAF2470662.1 hypothetical protein BDR25DRAFT_355139 [Lindgomyces ingoldianus]
MGSVTVTVSPTHVKIANIGILPPHTQMTAVSPQSHRYLFPSTVPEPSLNSLNTQFSSGYRHRTSTHHACDCSLTFRYFLWYLKRRRSQARNPSKEPRPLSFLPIPYQRQPARISSRGREIQNMIYFDIRSMTKFELQSRSACFKNEGNIAAELIAGIAIPGLPVPNAFENILSLIVFVSRISTVMLFPPQWSGTLT